MRGSVWTNLARFGVPGLLVAVAIGQQILVHRGGLSPWKGAGFGMFATIDRPQTRVIRAWRVDRNGRVPLDLDSATAGTRGRSSLERALAQPSPAALRAVAIRISEQTDVPLPPGSRVRIEVYRHVLEPETRRVNLEVLATLEVTPAEMSTRERAARGLEPGGIPR